MKQYASEYFFAFIPALSREKQFLNHPAASRRGIQEKALNPKKLTDTHDAYSFVTPPRFTLCG